MHYVYSPPVQIAHYGPSSSELQIRPVAAPNATVNLFDLAGRKLSASSGSFDGQFGHNGVFITTIKQSEGTQGWKRILIGK